MRRIVSTKLWRVESAVWVVAALIAGLVAVGVTSNTAYGSAGTISTVAVRTSPIGKPMTSLASVDRYLGHDTSDSLYLDFGTSTGAIAKAPAGGVLTTVLAGIDYQPFVWTDVDPDRVVGQQRALADLAAHCQRHGDRSRRHRHIGIQW